MNHANTKRRIHSSKYAILIIIIFFKGKKTILINFLRINCTLNNFNFMVSKHYKVPYFIISQQLVFNFYGINCLLYKAINFIVESEH